MRLVCVVYVVALTYLLLTPHPFGPDDTIPGVLRWIHPICHFLLMLILGLTCLMARWPIRLLSVTLLLTAYAIGTELLQTRFPPRTFEAVDLAQNIAGIYTALLIYWAALFLLRRRCSAASGGSLAPADQ
jgi:VanZ family protein